jgi:hypothetical protein
MLEIITPRHTVRMEEYSLSYENREMPGAGYGFPCDKDGNIFGFLNPIALSNLEHCRTHPELYSGPTIVDYSYDYREPTLARCKCGEEIYLDGDDMGECSCDVCERVYNVFGQELVGRTQAWSGQNEDGEYYSEEDAY